MPHIIVKYDTEAASLEDAVFFSRLNNHIVEAAAEGLSVPKLVLTTSDFSITYVAKGLNDRMTKDFEIVVFAHAFPERLDNPITEKIAAAVKKALDSSYADEATSYSVSLFVCPMGYVAGEAFPQPLTGGR